MFRSLASIFLLPSLPSFPPIPLPFLFLFSVKESDFNQELQSAPATKGVVVVIALSKLAFSDIKKLAEFLCSRQRLVGVNIRGDLTRLKNDFPLAGFDFQVAQILELPQLASDVLRIPLKKIKKASRICLKLSSREHPFTRSFAIPRACVRSTGTYGLSNLLRYGSGV